MKNKQGGFTPRAIIVSIFVQWFFDRIAPKKADRILETKLSTMNHLGTLVRTNPYLPKELYVVAAALGCFQSGETPFFTQLVQDYVDKKIKEMGFDSSMGNKTKLDEAFKE
jgi:hypothetical protein